MSQINTAQLEATIKRINTIQHSPLQPYIGNVGQVGCYYLSAQYGGYSLCRITNESGCDMDVLGCGHVTKRELFNLMQAFMSGLTEERPSHE